MKKGLDHNRSAFEHIDLNACLYFKLLNSVKVGKAVPVFTEYTLKVGGGGG